MMPLAVSIAAHSALMAPAAREFAERVASTPLQTPHTPVIGNVSAAALTTADAIPGRARGATDLARALDGIDSPDDRRRCEPFRGVGRGTVLAGVSQAHRCECRSAECGEARGYLVKMLQDKIAIVTGASRGIGAAIAVELASQGATVVVNHRVSVTQAETVVAQIVVAGGRALAIQADVSIFADADGWSKRRWSGSVGSTFWSTPGNHV